MYSVCFQLVGESAIRAHEGLTLEEAMFQFSLFSKVVGNHAMVWLQSPREVLVCNSLYGHRIHGRVLVPAGEQDAF